MTAREIDLDLWAGRNFLWGGKKKNKLVLGNWVHEPKRRRGGEHRGGDGDCQVLSSKELKTQGDSAPLEGGKKEGGHLAARTEKGKGASLLSRPKWETVSKICRNGRNSEKGGGAKERESCAAPSTRPKEKWEIASSTWEGASSMHTGRERGGEEKKKVPEGLL